MPPVITPLFSKPIYYNKLNIDTKKIVKLIEGKTRKSQNNRDEENNNDEFLYILENPELKFIKDTILNELKQFANNELKYVNDFKITTSWATIIQPSEKSQFHNHNNCMLSGVLYVQTNKNCGDIVFENFQTQNIQPKVTEWNVYNSRKWSYEPTDGDIIIFPSEVNHMIETNKSNIVRHSIAFNAIPYGLVGNDSSDSQIYL
jgi:uncharacterized protein (TIGR02466 family)